MKRYLFLLLFFVIGLTLGCTSEKISGTFNGSSETSEVSNGPERVKSESPSIVNGSIYVFSTADLSFEQDGYTSSQITYTISSPLNNGVMLNEGTTLGVGDTFTQADLENENLIYIHTEFDESTDQMIFSVTNSDGNSTDNNTFTLSYSTNSDCSAGSELYTSYTQANQAVDGSAGTPYIICSAAQFQDIGDNACSAGSQTDCDKYYRLGRNIDLSSATLTAIGPSFPWFSGDFDGNNRALLNYSSTSIKGLFEIVDGNGTTSIHDLYLQNINLSTTSDRAGIIAGETYPGSTLSNIKAYNITMEGDSYVGCLVGEANGSPQMDTFIEDSSCSGSITSTTGGYTGGIIGRAFRTMLKGLEFEGDVTGTAGNYAGGIAGGVSMGFLVDSTSRNSTISGGSWIGGVTGEGTNLINVNSISNTIIPSTGTAGAISGSFSDIYFSSSNGTVVNPAALNVNFIGGVAGAGQNVYNARITNTTLKGTQYIGGILGHLANSGVRKIQQCYAETSIEVNTGGSEIGGIVGAVNLTSTIIDDNFAWTSFSGTTVGGNFGGLVGVADLDPTIRRNLAVSNLNFTNNTNIYGIAGSHDTGGGTYSKNYFDLTTSTLAANEGLGAAVTPITNEFEGLATTSFYGASFEATSGWDFTNVWKSNTDNYPEIQQPASTVAVATSLNIIESYTGATIVVSLIGPPESGTITLDYATADGTATLAGTDYTNTTGTLTFNPGETYKTIYIPVNNDVSTEGDEEFYLTFFNPVNTSVYESQVTIYISDDD